ncbi:MFP1 attachment factor 1-like [Momordica charantia]|uniref:MFP1 attachment factor 1-like n=1 Tax=Momordica charantia TaxID=3673 RepID=A0A6J1BSC5_MOMCH|nr:MFP1 attachment factor 1-like [Momordica charantia]
MSEPQITASSPPPEAEPKEPTESPKPFGTKFSIWPPTQRTRDAVISRLIETLSTPSILSKRYGTIPPDEAAAAARLIEEEAYLAAGVSPATEDDGIEILQVYSKEISRRMLETVKGRAIPVAPAENGESEAPTPPVAPSEETPTFEN